MICWLEVERVGLRGIRERRIDDCWLKESEEISPLKLPGSRRLKEGLSVRRFLFALISGEYGVLSRPGSGQYLLERSLIN